MASRAVLTFKFGAAAARLFPLGWLCRTAETLGQRLGPRLMPAKAVMLTSHIRRAAPGLTPSEADAAMRRGLGSYARYWIESFRLPTLPAEKVADRFSVVGYHHVEAALAAGTGPILVLPHLGGWEWAGAWLSRVKHERVAAVVERLEPPELFDWFVELRSAYGIDVIPVGPEAIPRLVRAVRKRHIVCLLADRDLSGTGIEVEFFGERTTMPGGPALLARRTGAPLLPTAVYHRNGRCLGLVAPPVAVDPKAPLRAEVARVTQELARALERLIAAAPDQWHLLEPNWPSDLTGEVVPEPPPSRVLPCASE